MRAVKGSLALAMGVALALPAGALAQVDYPPAGNPGKGGGKPGKVTKYTVCKARGAKACDFRTISKAVKAANRNDVIRVKNGTYKESVNVTGSKYDGLKLIGNKRNPRKVVINGKSLRGAKAQNGVLINGADKVKVQGFYARNFKANGFFVVNVDGYTLTNLVAGRTGVYGIYAFNSKGGTMANSEAFYTNDAGFYIGQTPPQVKPKRSIVKNVKAYGNVLGFSGTNMRYVTIKNSSFYNNGGGIVPNALESEKFPPAENNVITGNRIFWNNFNYYRGAPFQVPDSGPAGLAGFPIGVGVLLFGSQDTTVSRNQIFGNWLTGFGAIQQIVLAFEDDPDLREAAVLRNNVVRDNKFGLGGRDLNGRDLFYDGSGTDNCFANNELFSPTLPASPSPTFAACPFQGQNTFNQAAQQEAIGWVPSKDDPASAEKAWIRHPHSSQPGVKPLERFTK